MQLKILSYITRQVVPIFILVVLVSNNGWSQSLTSAKQNRTNISKYKNLTKILRPTVEDYLVGNYQGSIDRLKKILRDVKYVELKGEAYYWLGLAEMKLQRYEDAEKSFVKTIKQNYMEQDLYYLLGQCYYANEKYVDAIDTFKRSIKTKYKVLQSQYYIGHSYQIQKKYTKSIEFYRQIIHQDSAEGGIKKAALFQMGEIFLVYSMLRKHPKHIIEKIVIPQYRVAIRQGPDSELNNEILKKIDSLSSAYNIATIDRMWNGRYISPKSFKGYLALNGKYDTNLADEADEAEVKIQNKASLYEQLELSLKHQSNYKGRYSFIPSLYAQYVYHNQRKNSDIYKNDGYYITPEVTNHFEYLMFNRKARITAKLKYQYQAKDDRGKKEIRFYDRYWKLSLGKSFIPVDKGESTLKLEYKNKIHYINAYSAKVLGLVYEQEYFLPSNDMIFTSISYEKSTTQEDLYSTTSYNFLVYFNFSAPLFSYYYILPSLNLTLLDPEKQKKGRGLEKNISPSLTILRRWKSFSVSLDYTYIKNISEDKSTYAYNKHIIGIGFKQKF